MSVLIGEKTVSLNFVNLALCKENEMVFTINERKINIKYKEMNNMAEQGKMKFVKGKLIEKTLKRETETWTLYTLTIETEDGKGNYSCFGSLGEKEGSKSLKLENLKVGTEYSFGVTENEKGKTVCFVNVPKDFSKKTDNATQTTSKKFDKSGEIAKVEVNKNAVAYQEFFESYVQECYKQKKQIQQKHFLGCFIWAFRNELGLNELTEWLDYTFENKIKTDAQVLENEDKEIQL
jgi:hypothetical protein